MVSVSNQATSRLAIMIINEQWPMAIPHKGFIQLHSASITKTQRQLQDATVILRLAVHSCHVYHAEGWYTASHMMSAVCCLPLSGLSFGLPTCKLSQTTSSNPNWQDLCIVVFGDPNVYMLLGERLVNSGTFSR